MTLKDLALSDKNVLYVNIYSTGGLSKHLSCNVHKDRNGQYRFEDAELTLEDLAEIDMRDVVRYGTQCAYDRYTGIWVYIDEGKIRVESEHSKAYSKLNSMLNKEYTKLYKHFEELETTYKNPFHSSLGLETIGPMIVVAIMGLFLFYHIEIEEDTSARVLYIITLASFILIPIVFIALDIRDNTKKYRNYGKLKEEYFKKIN